MLLTPQLLIFAASCCASFLAVSSSPSRPSMQDFLVKGLEEVEPEYAKFEGKMYAGRLNVDNGDRRGELMFWFFAPDNPIDKDSVTLWLNGGPGCSSFSGGVMFENSPVTVPLRPAGYCCSKADEALVYNKHAWTQATSMLYVEQPVGTGFSSGLTAPKVEADLAGDMYAFLQNFFQVFHEHQSSRLFIFGESYAGYFAPSIAYKIFNEMKVFDPKNDQNNDVFINLAGVGLGNGWVDTRVQGPATIDFAYWHGMYDEHTRQSLHAEWNHCINSGKNTVEPKPFHKLTTPDDCAMMVANTMAGGKGIWPDNPNGPNAYDVSTWDGYPVLLAGNTTIENFFNDPRVREKLHAPDDVHWQGCIPGAGRRQLVEEGRRILALLDHDDPVSTIPYLAEMLDSGVRVLVYNGDRDLCSCAQGSEMLLNAMEWGGSEGWFTTRQGLWVNNANNNDKVLMPAGYAKSHKGLDFVVVYNSGHLVPYNQPENALDLITRFIKNESYFDFPMVDFDFYHKTKNPGITYANGMNYPLSTAKSTNSSDMKWGFLATVVSFIAGILCSTFFHGRRGYQNID